MNSDEMAEELLCSLAESVRLYRREAELKKALVSLIEACELWAGDESSTGASLLPRRVAAAIENARAAGVEEGPK